MTSTPDRNCTHLAGEYFVAAELSKRGYAIGITMGNAKAIDLFAVRDANTANIQVKAIGSRTYSGWPMMLDQVRDNVVYVFVCLNECDEAPAYFILTPSEVRENLKQYATRGIVRIASVQTFKGRWERIDEALAPRE